MSEDEASWLQFRQSLQQVTTMTMMTMMTTMTTMTMMTMMTMKTMKTMMTTIEMELDAAQAKPSTGYASKNCMCYYRCK